jgi:ParB family chromosome partitioning protein
MMAAEDLKRKGLGRGLSALLGDRVTQDVEDDRSRGLREVPIELVTPNPDQPRKTFDPEKLAELTASIREKGVIQPLIVRRNPRARPGQADATYEILAGERRWRASQAAGLHVVPVVVREVDDPGALEIAIIENVQRADLDAIEEAEGYSRLIDQFGHAQEEVARLVGKSRPHVANMLRLLTLPQSVRALVRAGRLSAGHARALITAPDPQALAERSIAKGLSVREVEALARRAADPAAPRRGRPPNVPAPAKDADTRALEENLTASLGLEVDIAHWGAKGGTLTITYNSLDDLDAICRRLSLVVEE